MISKLICLEIEYKGTAVAQWLRCCATNRKVAGSIPDGVIGIFHWHNPPDRTMTLGSTQPLIEMSTRRISWGVNAAVAWGWQPYHLPVLLSWNLGTLTSWKPLAHSRPVTGLIYLYWNVMLEWLARKNAVEFDVTLDIASRHTSLFSSAIIFNINSRVKRTKNAFYISWFLNLWYAYRLWYDNHCLLVYGRNKKIQI